MGKLGRFACIFVPMALTLGSLICLILVFSGQLNKNNSLQRDLYFFKANTSQFVSNPDNEAVDEANKYFDNDLLKALQGAVSTNDLQDFYLVGLWNYCEGNQDDKTGKETVTKCSKREANYWFNPIEVWDLENTTAQKLFPDKMKDGLDVYRKVSKWMFAAYVIAICLTAAEFVVGIFAIFSRWGSLVTTIVSTAQTIFIMAAAITSTALYGTLVGVFETVLKPYEIKASTGSKMLSVLWIGVAFSIASGFFWLISVCCCSGKSGHKKVVVEKTPYTYERVASPYLGAAQHGHEMHPPVAGHGTSGSAYEPYRAQHV
ncbi:integral membrane protein-like protein [Lophiotrema nucula]|uniref:Integral membrane protein-like protein n=1 Tax=Lophiotrema nucula TaxID=690887 RepID=A0A6A5YPZ3_9PLEO|nr:integral membrane protein-like protein [Lophiotrema nucula]